MRCYLLLHNAFERTNVGRSTEDAFDELEALFFAKTNS